MERYRKKFWASLLRSLLNDVYLPVSISFLLLLIPFSCVQNVELDLLEGNEKVLVIESEFNNLNTGNYVRLTWLRQVQDKQVLPIDNALIIVSSDSGESDTLEQEYNDDDLFKGYYFSNNLICKPNRTYKLKIDVGGQIYEATATMPRPPKIDSLRLDSIYGPSGKFNSTLPFMYFKEPVEEKNYYMAKVCYDGNNEPKNPCEVVFPKSHWGLLLLDDQYLPAYVNGINVNLPSMPKDDYVQVLSGDYLAILYSVTPESFAYYQALLEALKSDGGVYSPSPANHPTNIKSDHKVVGFFHVVSLDSYPFHAPSF